MKILIITPSFLPAISGNARTVARWASGLSARGEEVVVCDMSQDPSGEKLAAAFAEVAPDVIHAHHAWKGGRWLGYLSGAGAAPRVVSFAGTDLLALEGGGEAAASVGKIAQSAARIVAPGQDTLRRLQAALPALSGRMRLVPKGIWIDDEAYPLRAEMGYSGQEKLFLLTGGVRRVKNQLFAVRAWRRLLVEIPEARLVLAGPVIDPDYAALVEQEGEGLALRRIEVPPAAMGGAYREADVVLNVSESEGFSNALLEAMSAGRAVLASRIGANAEAVEEGKTGLLFAPGDEKEFVAKGAALARDESLRARLGEAARTYVAGRYDAAAEIDALTAVYKEVMGHET